MDIDLDLYRHEVRVSTNPLGRLLAIDMSPDHPSGFLFLFMQEVSMKSVVRISFNVIFTLLFSACVAATPAESSPTEGINAPAVTPILTLVSVPTATPTSLPEILPTPASITSFDERLLATFEIFKEPDEMVFVKGYLWTKTADGHVVQIDPATNTVTADIKVDTTTDPFHFCQGLGTDGEDIWVCSASGDADNRTIDTLRVDPESQRIVETFKVGKIFEQFDLAFLLNQIWVLTGSGDTLVGIDVTNSEVSPPIDLGARCFQLALVGKSLMATCSLDNVILQIDPEKREVTRRVDIKNPRFIAGDENGVWLALGSAIIRLDPKSLNPVVTFTNLPSMATGDIFVTNEAVWVRHETGFLFRIDPARNQIVEQIKIDKNLAGGSVLVTSDSIWATAYDNNLLFRLSLK